MREENGKIERAGQRCCVLERTNMRVQGEDRVSRRGGLRVQGLGVTTRGSRRAWRSRSSRIGIKFIDPMNHNSYGVS